MAFEDEKIAIACLKQLLGSAMAAELRVPGRVVTVGRGQPAANDPDVCGVAFASLAHGANSGARSASPVAFLAFLFSGASGLLIELWTRSFGSVALRAAPVVTGVLAYLGSRLDL